MGTAAARMIQNLQVICNLMGEETASAEKQNCLGLNPGSTACWLYDVE